MHRLAALLLIGLLIAAGANAQVLPSKPAESPREVFRLFEMDDPFFGSFVDDKPLSDAEKQKLWKVLMRVSEFRLIDLERWARHGDQWPLMLDDPITWRSEVFEIVGQAQRATAVPVDGDMKARYGFKELWRVDILARDGTPVTIITTTIPRGWPTNAPIDEPASALGVLVKRMADEETNPPRLVFAAPRVAWHPKTLLGNLGMDEGLFDNIQHRRPITASERETFYQLLATAARTKPHELESEAFAQLKRLAENLERNRSAYDGDKKRKAIVERQLARARERRDYVVPMFNEPESQNGKLVMFEGDARRCVEVRVNEDDIAERFGIRSYYEIAVFTDDSQGNPLIFCVTELPGGMPVGEDIRARVRIPGFFLKSWAYPQGKSGKAGEGPKQQLAPLILGRDVRLFVAKSTASDFVVSAVVVSVILVSMVGILWAAWRSGNPSITATVKPAATAAPDFSALE